MLKFNKTFQKIIKVTIFISLLLGSSISAEWAGRISDIYSGAENSKPYDLTIFKDKVYFSAIGANRNVELYELQADSSWAIKCYDINSIPFGSDPNNLIVYKDKLYFSAAGICDQVAWEDYELWSFDGNSFPELVMDIWQTPTPGGSRPRYFNIFNDKLYFSAFNWDVGLELWSYDGYSLPSVEYELIPGHESLDVKGSVIYKDKLYFQALAEFNRTGLYAYDGVNPPEIVWTTEISSSYNKFIVLGDKLLFRAADFTHGTELWEYDGVHTPRIVMDIYVGTDDASVDEMIIYKNKLYFRANMGPYNGSVGHLYEYDGTNLPERVKYTNTEYLIYPTNLTIHNNKLYFFAKVECRLTNKYSDL